MPADDRIDRIGPEDLFRLRPAESVTEQFQRTRFLRQLYPVVARAFDDRAVLEVDASFDKRGRRGCKCRRCT